MRDDVARSVGFVVLGGFVSLWVGNGCSSCAEHVGIGLPWWTFVMATAVVLVVLPLASLAVKS